MAAGDLTSLDSVKGWLGLDAGLTTDDALLTRLISAVSGFIQAWLSRTIASQAYTETRDGNGGRQMPFRNTPVTAVASVSIDGIAVPPGDAVATPGYYFTDTMLMLNGYGFARGLGNVHLAYTAGYASVPPEIEQAAIELIAFRYREATRVGVASKAMAGETTAFVIKDMPPSVATILSQYRRVVPV